jgi:hypothetical protein
VGLEDARLLGGRQARVQRQHLDARPQPAGQGLGRVADLALAAEEHEHVAGAVAQQLLDGVADRVDGVAVGRGGEVVVVLAAAGRLRRQRPVAHVDREGATGHLDDRRVAEVAAEAGRVDRRARDDELEVGALGQQAVQVAEQEVDVQAALVRLVDDHRVVAAQHRVVADLGQQQPVGHEPHERVARRAVGEADRVADRLADPDAELVGDALGDRASGQPARLRVGDRAAHAAPELEADLRQLRRLARAGLAGDDHDLVACDRGEQVVATCADRQLRRVADGGHGRAAALHRRLGAGDLAKQRVELALVVAAAHAIQAPAQAVLVAQRQRAEALAQLGERRRLLG